MLIQLLSRAPKALQASRAVTAATHSTVDAAVMSDPALAVAQKCNLAIRILADTRNAEGVRSTFAADTCPASILYSSSSWLAAHRDQAARLAGEIHRTLDWMGTHTAEEIRDKMPPRSVQTMFRPTLEACGILK